MKNTYKGIIPTRNDKELDLQLTIDEGYLDEHKESKVTYSILYRPGKLGYSLIDFMDRQAANAKTLTMKTDELVGTVKLNDFKPNVEYTVSLYGRDSTTGTVIEYNNIQITDVQKSSSSSSSSGEGDGSNVGAIIGITLGVLVFLIVASILVKKCLDSRRQNDEQLRENMMMGGSVNEGG